MMPPHATVSSLGPMMQGASQPKVKTVQRSAREKPQRPRDDHYPTPPDVTRALLLAEPELRAAQLIWEPACGAGDMASALSEYGATVIATDLMDHGYGGAGVNFLHTMGFPQIGRTYPRRGTVPKGRSRQWPRSFTGEAIPIVTNPPFNCEHGSAAGFISHAVHTLRSPFVAMLLKQNFWNAKQRLSLFHRCPPTRIYPLTWRPDFKALGAPVMDVMWCVWSKLSPTKRLVRPLMRPAPREQLELIGPPAIMNPDDRIGLDAITGGLWAASNVADPVGVEKRLIAAGWRPPFSDLQTVLLRRNHRGSKDSRAWRKECAEKIANIVRLWFNVERAEFWKATRGAPKSSDARKVAYYLGNVIAGATLTELSEVFGRARRTVEKGIWSVEEARAVVEFDIALSALERLSCQLVMGVAYEELVRY